MKRFSISTLKNSYTMGGILSRTLNDNVALDDDQSSDEHFMRLALLQAMNAIGWSAPNPSVGCVFVKNNRVVAEGYTQAYGKEHAERYAIQNVKNLNDLVDSTLYVTLEPCSHFGQQPPCVDFVIEQKIKKVVIACIDPDERVSGEGVKKLKSAGVEVVIGVLENEVKAWHFPFLKNRLTSRPVWIAKWAQTESGHVADADGNSKWISGAQSRAYTHWLRQRYDAILVGAETWLRDQPQLNVRDCARPHRRNPIRMVYDPRKKIKDKEHGVLYFHETSVRELIQAVESYGYNKPLQSIFCEGGATLLNLLFQENRIDAVHRFTGKKQFQALSDRYRLCFEANSDWIQLVNHQIQDDVLHEFVKCF